MKHIEFERSWEFSMSSWVSSPCVSQGAKETSLTKEVDDSSCNFQINNTLIIGKSYLIKICLCSLKRRILASTIMTMMMMIQTLNPRNDKALVIVVSQVLSQNQCCDNLKKTINNCVRVKLK